MKQNVGGGGLRQKLIMTGGQQGEAPKLGIEFGFGFFFFGSCIIACFSDVGLPSLFVTALSNISCFVKWNAHFQTFLLVTYVTLASRGTLPSVFGVKCKSCSAGTSIC